MATPDRHELDETVLRHLEPFVFEATQCRGGSISAEHGLGQAKNEYIELLNVYEGSALHTMCGVKQLLDPRGILNPYKYLPTTTNPFTDGE